jgi:site-specific recombinase XerD
MLLPIKLICKRDKVRRNGTSLIAIQYCYNSDKRTLLSTGIAIPPAYWNRKSLRISKELPTVFGKAEELNQQLQEMMRLAEDIVSIAVKKKMLDPVAVLKSTFKPGLDPHSLQEKTRDVESHKVNLNLFFQIDEYIESKRKKVSPLVSKVYLTMRNHLQAFEEHRRKQITFECFDINFYESFINFLSYEYVQRRKKDVIIGIRTNTIAKTIKNLRIFLRNRMRRRVIAPINLEDFKIIEEETDAIYLTWEEIKNIYLLELTNYPQLVKYRDLFVLGCLTGLRFSDFSIIRPEDIRQGMLYKKQDKSDQWVVIPLRNEANHILMHQFENNFPRVSNPEFNKYIKEVGKLAGISEPIKFSHKKGNRDVIIIKPKYAWITSHTCRRSFCTNEFLAGTPVELIMKISGHKSIRDFYKYIRITHEEAGKEIMELWQQRGDMNIVNYKKANHSPYEELIKRF